MFHIDHNFIRYMESSNPVLKRGFANASDSLVGTRMSLNGTIMKTAALLFLVFCSATYTWYQVTHGENYVPWVFGGMIGALVLCLVTVFKSEWAAFTAPCYALCKGLFLGGLSALFETKYPGLVLNAVGLTLSVLLVMLAVYRMGWLRATPRFVKGVVAATAGILVFYLVSLVLSMFGIAPVMQGSSTLSIGFSLLVVGIAAMNLILDFAVIEDGIDRGAPLYMEWYAAFSLVVTLVWIYVEILNLLRKFQGRN